MQITQTASEGLLRSYKVVIAAADIESRVTERLRELGQTVKVPGFRPGKIPMPLLKQRYGQSVMGEILDRVVTDSSAKAIEENQLKPALQPKFEDLKFEDGKDLEFTMNVEVLPEFEPGDIDGIVIDKPVVAVTDAMVDEALDRVAQNSKVSVKIEEDRPAATGDVLLIDFDGSVDGERRPGMKGEDFELTLGSGTFIPGFEDQLVGVKGGEHRSVTVTFPASYHAKELAGREAVFEVDVKELREAKAAAPDDALATSLGFETLDKLKEAIRERIGNDYGSMSRMRAKRQLLDRLAELHSFAVPSGMVEIEFGQIWERLQEELKSGEADEADKAKGEDELRAEYRAIAERRVRLGLVLSEVGRRNNVTVTRDELSRAIFAEAQRYRGQEQQVLEFFKSNPQAVESLRAPLFEDKVVDFILGKAKVTETPVSAEELMRDPDDEAAAA